MNRQPFTKTANRKAADKGSVLLICLGVLAILSLLGTAALFIARQEEKNAHAFMDQTRASFAAESGMEYAVAKLMQYNGDLMKMQNFFGAPDKWSAFPIDLLPQSSFGQFDVDGDGLKETSGYVSESYTDKGDRYKLRVNSTQSKLNINDPNTPLNFDTDPYEDQLWPERDYAALPRHQKHPDTRDPDWAYGPGPNNVMDPDINLDGWVDNKDVDTILKAFQGQIANPLLKKRADLNNNGNAGFDDIGMLTPWLASGFDPNRSPDGKPHIKGPRRMEVVAENLLDALFPEAPIAAASTSRAKMTAQLLFRARRALPNDRFDNLYQVQDALVKEGLLSQSEFDILSNYITLHSWQDDKVLRPSFQWKISTPHYSPLIPEESEHESIFTSPLGGESWGPGNSYAITWEDALPVEITSVYLALYKGSEIIDPFGFGGGIGVPDSGTFNWTVPAGLDPAANYRIRLVKMLDGIQMAVHDSNIFAIGMPFPDSPEPDSESQHPTQYAGDYDTHANFLGLDIASKQPDPRPAFDSNNNRDIYFFSDMQTKHFELDTRSPIDVNSAPKELIQALISPIRGWYMKEAPNAGETPTAEDWDQACKEKESFPNPQIYGFPWLFYSSPVRAGHFVAFSEEEGYLGWGWGPWGGVNRFYYYDEKERNYTNYVSSIDDYDVQYMNKSGRYGLLSEAGPLDVDGKALGLKNVASALASAIYKKVHGILPGPMDDNPFETWEEFEYFILDLAENNGSKLSPDPNFVAGFDRYMAHALIANFNPNSRLNDFNPNKTTFLFVDKAQLIVNTTEFCFHPMGYFEFESYGVVANKAGKVEQSSKAHSVSKVLEVLRLSTQADFMEGYDPAQGPAKFFSASASVSPSAGSTAGFDGYALQSYPEPECDTENYIGSSLYDGLLMPATLKTRDADYFDGVGVKNFIVDFDKTLDASKALGNGENYQPSSNDLWKTIPIDWTYYDPMTSNYDDPSAKVPSNQPGIRKLTRSLQEFKALSVTQRLPGQLFPDGALSDTGRTLGWKAANNIGRPADSGAKGAVQFWVKPNYDVAHSNRIRKLFSFGAKAENDTSVYSYVSPGLDLYYFSRGGERVARMADGSFDDNIYLAYSSDPDLTMNGHWLPTRAMFLNAFSSTPMDNLAGTGTMSCNQSWRSVTDTQASSNGDFYNVESHQWSNISIAWNKYVSPLPANFEFIRMYINGQIVDGRDVAADLRGASGTTPYQLKDWGGAVSAEGYFRFGERSEACLFNESADATFDDLVSADTFYSLPNLSFEYDYGRYYSENDATYSSPEINLASKLNLADSSLTLKFIAWTLNQPKPLKNTVVPDHFRFNDNRDAASANQYTDFKGIEKLRDAGGNFLDSFPADPMFRNGWKTRAEIPLSFDIFDANANSWRYDGQGADKMLMPNYAGGSIDPLWQSNPLQWNASQIFKFRAHFNIDDTQTLYTAPSLDDITFVFQRSKAKILSWETN